MGYIFFDFVKDSEIDPNEAFKQNVENFLSDLSLGFISRYYDEHQEIRDKYLTDLFTEIKNLIDENNTTDEQNKAIHNLLDVKDVEYE